MIYIGLPFKVVLRSGLKNLAKVLKVSYEDLKEVQGYCSYIDPMKKSGSLTLKEKEWYDNKDKIMCDGETERDYIGSTGVINLCKAKKVEVPTVSCVYIPGLVWNELKVMERKDISKLLHNLEKRVNRYRLLNNIGAPEIIIRNEARMLENDLYALDDNSGTYGLHTVLNDKEKPCISLKDIEFDLNTYKWKDPLYDPKEDESPYMDIKVPGYLTPEEYDKEHKSYEKVCEDYTKAQKEIDELKLKVLNLESYLKHEKEKCKKIAEERDRKVQALSKENLVLDHKVDELLEKIQSMILTSTRQ